MKRPALNKSAAVAHQLGGEYLWRDNIPIGMVIVENKTNTLLRVNQAYCRFLGYSKQELLGKRNKDFIHPDDWKKTAEKIRQLNSNRHSFCRLENRHLHKSGKTVWGEVSSTLIDDGSSHPKYRFTQIVDITKRKEAEDALLQNQNILTEAMKLGKVGGWEFDIDTLEQKWTEETYRIHEVDPSYKPTVSTGIAFYAKDSRPIIKRAVQRAITHAESFDVELEIVTGKGNIRNVHAIGHCDRKRRKVCGFFHDITQRKQDEKKLKEANNNLEQKVKDRTIQLKKLTEELIKAEHHERRRIADILHDQHQQHLCGMKFRASELKERSSDPSIVGLAEQLVNDFDKAIHVARTLSADIYPQVLIHMGLKDCIEWLATDMREKLGLEVKTRVSKQVALNCDEMRMFIFDAIRELLLNVVKHAKAKTVEVSVSPMTNTLVRIQVKDAGVGFDTKRNNEASRHLGLFRIRERVESFGGRFRIDSHPNKGTCISIILPRGKR